MYEFITSVCTIAVAAVLPLWFTTQTRIGREMAEGIARPFRAFAAWRRARVERTLTAQLHELRGGLAYWRNRFEDAPDAFLAPDMISYLHGRIHEVSAQLDRLRPLSRPAALPHPQRSAIAAAPRRSQPEGARRGSRTQEQAWLLEAIDETYKSMYKSFGVPPAIGAAGRRHCGDALSHICREDRHP